jgi:hypothetical protein
MPGDRNSEGKILRDRPREIARATANRNGFENRPEEIARAVINNKEDWDVVVDKLRNHGLTNEETSLAQEVSLESLRKISSNGDTQNTTNRESFADYLQNKKSLESSELEELLERDLIEKQNVFITNSAASKAKTRHPCKNKKSKNNRKEFS